MKINEIIRTNRKERGLTQDELAKYLGVSAPAVNKWEKGQSYPDITLLPVLAAFFNISVDELLGYEPQMMKGEIKKLYHRLAGRFSSEPYEDVKAECEEYMKKYHSCFPLLLQMTVLLLNHLQLAPDPQEVLKEIVDLLDCVITKSEDVQLAKEAVLMKGGCYLMMQKPSEVLDMLGGEIHAMSQEAEMQAQAYQMKGDCKKAEEALQVCMYQHLLMLIGDTAMQVAWEKEAAQKTDEKIRRTLALIDLFHVERLHFNAIAETYLAFAQYYCISNRPEDAIDILGKFVDSLMQQKLPLNLHGDEYFDQIDEWLSELALGTDLPRDEKTVFQSIIQVVADNPIFECLKEYPQFRILVKRLEDFCNRSM